MVLVRAYFNRVTSTEHNRKQFLWYTKNENFEKKFFFSCFDMFRFNNDTVVHQQSGSNLFAIMFEDLLKVVSASFLLVCF